MKSSDAFSRSVFVLLLFSLLFAFLMRDLQFGYYPERNSNIITVRVELKGAWQEQIEEVITNPLEAEFRALKGIRKMVSRSEEERAVMTLSFHDRVDLNQAYLDVRELVDRAYRAFPGRTQKPEILMSSTESYPVFVLMLQERGSYSEDSLKRLFEGVRGTGMVEISGAPQQELTLHVDDDRLQEYGMTRRSLADVFNGANRIFSVPVRPGLSFVVDNRFKDLGDISQQYLRPGLQIATLASPELTDASVRSISRVDGQSRSIIWVRQSGDANTISLCRNLRKLAGTLPPSRILYDKGALIEDALRDILLAVSAGMLAVVVMTALFLGNVKHSLLLCLNIPFSLAGTMGILNIMGKEIDLLILSGLAMGTGMIIDAGVVFLEAGPKEGRTPILYSLASTLLVFSSLIFAPASLKTVYASLIWSISLCLTLSVLYILVILPGFGVSGKEQQGSRMTILTQGIFQGLRRYRIVGLALLPVILVVCAYIVRDSRIQQDIRLEDNTFRFSVEFPSGTVKESVEQELRNFETALAAWEDVEYFTADYRQEKGSFNLKVPLLNKRLGEDLEQRIRQNLAGLDCFPFFPSDGSRQDYLIRLTGHDRSALYGTAGELSALLDAGGYWDRVIRHYKSSRQTLSVLLDIDAAGFQDVIPGNIYNTVQSILSPPVTGKWIPPQPLLEDQKSFDLKVSDPAARKPDLAMLLHMPMPLGNGKAAPLNLLSVMEQEDNYGPIMHYDSLRGVSLSLTDCTVSGRTLIRAVDQALDNYQLPEGIRIIHGEEVREQGRFGRKLLLCVSLSLVLIFLLLVFLFESWKVPVFLLMQLPLTLILPTAILTLAGVALSPAVFFGLVLIAGVAVNNGIILFSQAGKNPDRFTLIRAFEDRSRSLFTAAATTIAGILPLLFSGKGIQGLLPSLSLTVCIGLLVSLGMLYISSDLLFRK